MCNSDFIKFQNGLQNILNDDILAKNVLTDEYNIMQILNQNPDFNANGSIQCTAENYLNNKTTANFTNILYRFYYRCTNYRI